MGFSTRENLEAIAHHIPSELVSHDALSKLYKIAEILPPFSNALLEIRLAENDSQVDLSIPLSYFKFDSKPSFSINLLNANLLNNSIWKKYNWILHDFERILDTSLPTGIVATGLDQQRFSQVARGWLEFDINEDTLEEPVPAFGLDFVKPRKDVIGKDRADILFWAEQLLLPFNREDEGLPENLVLNLDKCNKYLPDGARIIFLGVNPSIRTNVLRLIINGIPPNQLLNYLVDVGWMYPSEELERTILEVSNLVDNIVLSFNIGDTIFSRIGLECYLIDPRQVEDRWKLFLDYLVKTELCTPSKSKALLSWTNMNKAGDFTEFTICTKIIYQPDKPLEAKAYLGMWNNIDSFV